MRQRFNRLGVRWATQDRLKLWVLGLVTLADGLVVTLTLGHITTEWRASVLFSNWMDS